MRLKIVLPVMIVLALCLSPGAAIRTKIASSVAASAPDMLGPGKYSVDVTGGLIGLLRGRIEKIDIHGSDVKMSNGMIVDRLNVGLNGVHFKRDQTVTKVESTGFAASVSEDNLTDYLRASRGDMKEAEITLADGRLCYAGRPRVLGLKVKVKAEGTLDLDGNTKVHMSLCKCSGAGIKTPGMVRGWIERRINPVFDATQMGVDAKLKSVEVAKGAIALAGTADVNKKLAKQ